MKIYPSVVKKIALSIIVVEWAALIAGIVYFAYTKYHPNVLGVNVTRIDSENIVFRPTETLKHYYEWKVNQTITHERPWLPYRILAVTNSDGLIGDIDYQIDKPPEAFRVVALGDSFTEGPYVEYEGTYPKKLEIMLNANIRCARISKFEVMNFGVGGYDIEYAAHRYLLRGQKYKPDMILWFLKDDDFIEFTEEVKKKTVKNDITKFNKYDQAAKELKESAPSPLEKQTAAVRSVTQTTDKPVVLFTFGYTSPMYKSRMKQWANTDPNIKFFDGIRNINELAATFNPNDSHPNSKGYEIIAHDVYEHLAATVPFCGTSN